MDYLSLDRLAPIKEWVIRCEETHIEYGLPAQDKNIFLQRVIDVGPSDGRHNPRLVTTNNERVQYICLSHC
jgi:hypothetical protein